MDFERTFHSAANRARDNFLSRLFGIFNEEIVRIWCRDKRAPYEDLGRPTISADGGKGYTLDFTFRDRADGSVWVVEMKCELAYDNYKYLRLTHPAQLDHHKKDAFRHFLALAKSPGDYIVRVGETQLTANGALLVWGSCTADGVNGVVTQCGLRDVLSLESVIGDLLRWRNREYLELVERYEVWSSELFSALVGRGRRPTAHSHIPDRTDATY
jgi:hypothetical protein